MTASEKEFNPVSGCCRHLVGRPSMNISYVRKCLYLIVHIDLCLCVRTTDAGHICDKAHGCVRGTHTHSNTEYSNKAWTTICHLRIRSLKFRARLPAEVSVRITSITLLILQPGLSHNKMHFFFLGRKRGVGEESIVIKAWEREQERDKP